jgi:glycosyltransferase involved in cell wall biosynthesis
MAFTPANFVNDMTGRLKVLVVGQTPPPVHGQAVMIERLLHGQYEHLQLYHVRMAFSDSIGDVGRFRLGKLLHLVSVIVQIAYQRIVHRIGVLYYPPTGPNRVPLYRDLAILLCTRWMFRCTVFHLHASGISEIYPQLSRGIRFLFRCALFHPDAVIRLTRGHSNDTQLLQPRREYVVPYGIKDEFSHFEPAQAVYAIQQTEPNAPPQLLDNGSDEHVSRRRDGAVAIATAECQTCPPLQILFVGALRESKGVMILIEACGQLATRGVPFELTLMGDFHLPDFASQVRRRMDELGIAECVHFYGVLQGRAKFAVFNRAEVFCLPTHYESEAFPVVLLEALSFALPVVATRWRGIPEIVDDGANGFLVDINDPCAVANCFEQLHNDPAMRHRMGQLGREKFLREFTAARHLERMEQVFVDVATQHELPTAAIGAPAVEGDPAC